MNILLYIISGTVEGFLYLLSFAIILRLLLPLIGREEGLLNGLAIALTEPIVGPVRAVLSKNEFFESSPLDFSFMIVIMGIFVINMFIPTASSFL